MKRIEFIAPVESMRGNLSGKQDLRYAEDDNKAYFGPQGVRNYARNYSPRLIGAKIASSGKKYFTVRTKSASNLTARSLKAMALMGGTGAIVGAILHDHTSSVYQGIYAQWLKLQELGSKYSLRKYMSDTIRQALMTYQANIAFAGPLTVVTIKNPWYNGSQTAGANIGNGIISKFWTQLHADGVTFSIDGVTGIGADGYTLGECAQIPVNSILNLTSETVGQNEYAKSNGRWLLTPDGEYALYDDAQICPYGKYTTTATAPTA